jgi:hypothetical protein
MELVPFEDLGEADPRFAGLTTDDVADVAITENAVPQAAAAS